MKSLCYALLGAIAFALSCTHAHAAETEIKVATRVVPPLVIDDGNGNLSGFSIELWNGIAERLGFKSAYTVAPDVKALLETVASDKAELGIAAISITAERDRAFDFSLPILDAGLQILVRGGADGNANPLEGFLRLLFSPALFVWLGIAAVLIIVPAHIIWFLERNHDEGIVPKGNYIPGIFHAMWWAASTLATQAEQMPRHWLSRVLAVLWMFVGVVFVAYYTAQLTAQLTVQEIRGAISGPGDLPGKKVATTHGSTAAAWLKQQKAQVTEVEAIADAYAALRDGSVDAVVFDSPVLLSYAAKEGQGHVRVVAQSSARKTTASCSSRAANCAARSMPHFSPCAKTALTRRSTTNGSRANDRARPLHSHHRCVFRHRPRIRPHDARPRLARVRDSPHP